MGDINKDFILNFYNSFKNIVLMKIVFLLQYFKFIKNVKSLKIKYD
jgi:hypothetical protein